MEMEFDELSIRFDLEGINITEEEKDILISAVFNSEGVDKFNLKDKPKIRQTINDTIDMLNKGGEISDRVAENITYSIHRLEGK